MSEINGNPSAEQQRFHDELRELGCVVTGSNCPELHHVFGSKWKAKGFKKPGEWIIIPLCHDVHQNIKDYTFEEERNLFRATLDAYWIHFDKLPPVPSKLVKYVRDMRHRQDITRIA